MCFAYNAYLFTLLIPSATLSLINADLGPDTRYTWITISWNLGGAIFITIGGKMSDIFGRRWFFIGGSVILVIGSILGATAHSIDQMIATGVLFGVGSGLLETCFSAVQEIVPNKSRGLYTGLMDISSVVSQIMPLIAWVMIKYTGTWRNMYYLMIGFQSLACVWLYCFYHPPTFKTKHASDGKTKAQLLKEFDWIGLFLFISGCALFIVGVNWGGTVYPWKSAGTLAPIIVGFFTLVALGVYETHGNLKNPILAPHLFRQFRQ
jgi:MFS family permease